MPSVSSSPTSATEELQWTVRVHGAAASESHPLVVHGRNLMPLVARLVADARVQDIVVRPRVREVRAHVREPAGARGQK
jgi:hypothetical protein